MDIMGLYFLVLLCILIIYVISAALIILFFSIAFFCSIRLVSYDIEKDDTEK